MNLFFNSFYIKYYVPAFAIDVVSTFSNSIYFLIMLNYDIENNDIHVYSFMPCV